MKKILFSALLTLLLVFPSNTYAIYDPLSLPNNKFGIHILTTSEIETAAKLTNSSGGEWGYVTIPIQSGDRDILKWQKFMDQAKKLHIIPIIRLATEGDYFNTTVWRKPEDTDILDFANFLNSLNWPTKNRYIIVFNEVNRADEWGGAADPSDYAQLLSYAVTIFKSQNEDFFIISGGMDNASANDRKGDMNEYTFFSLMDQEVPGIFNQVDGISSHSYPNPGFSMSSSFLNTKTIDTFYYEKRFIERISSKIMPVFITETGWDADKVNKNQIASFYKDAFSNVWNDNSIVAVTPFLLNAGTGPFSKFSFMNADGSPNEIYKSYSSITKIKGTPLFASVKNVLSVNTNSQLPVKNYDNRRNIFSDKIDKLEKIVNILFRF